MSPAPRLKTGAPFFSKNKSEVLVMGLDVYLYHSNNWDEFVRLNEEYSQAESAIYEEARRVFDVPPNTSIWNDSRPEITDYIDTELEALKDKYNIADGEYHVPGIVNIELDSRISPEHMYKIGYFRSSYNGGGFNHVVETAIGFTLYDVFDSRVESNDDGGYNIIDWEDAKGKAMQLVERLNEFVESPASGYTVSCFETRNPFAQYDERDGHIHYVKSEELALQHFLESKELHKNAGNFGSLSGDFFLGTPLQVHAIIKGQHLSDHECMYVISGGEGTKEYYKWYLEAAKIVEETIDYVLSQPDPENYRVVWSG
jgi:hypothetical protein